MEGLETERVGDDGDAGEGHCGGGEHGVKDSGGGEGDHEDVVAERPDKVPADGFESGAGEADADGDLAEVVSHEGDVGGFVGDVGAVLEGDAEVGLGEGGGVVEAVADHCDFALFLEIEDDLDFVLGEGLGDDLVDVGLGGDVVGGAGVVAGDHDGGEAEGFEVGDALGGVGGESVGDGEGSEDLVVLEDDHRGFALVLPGFDDGGEILREGGLLLGGGGAEDGGFLTLNLGDDAFSGDGLGLGGREERLFGFFSVGVGDGFGEGVFASGFDAGGEAKEGVGVVLEGVEVSEDGFAFGEGAGFVEEDGFGFGGSFEGGGVFDEDAEFGPASGADDEGGGGGESEGAGAGDDEDGDGGEERAFEVLVDGEVSEEGQDGDDDDDGDEDRGDAVDETLDGGFAGLGALDEADDLGEGGLVADFGGLGDEGGGSVDGTGGEGGTGSFGDGDGFAGEHGFVDVGFAFEDEAVDGDFGTGFEEELVADLDLGDGDDGFLAVLEEDGGGWGEVEKFFNRVGHFGLGVGF